MFQDIDNLQEALWHIEQVDKSILNAYQNELLSASKTYIQTLLNDLERGSDEWIRYSVRSSFKRYIRSDKRKC